MDEFKTYFDFTYIRFDISGIKEVDNLGIDNSIQVLPQNG